MMQFTKCEQQIKWTNNPKIFVEVTILSVAQRHNFEAPKKQEESSEQLIQLNQKVTELEKQLQKLSSAETHSKQAAPSRREHNRSTTSMSPSIPTVEFRNILDHAE